MMKKLLSSVAMAAIFCSLAMAQGAQGQAPASGPGQEGMSPPPAGSVTQSRGRMGFGGPMHRMRAHGPMRDWWKNPRVAQKLGLTDDQLQQLEKISYDSRMKMIDLHAAVQKEQLELGHELQADHPNEDAVLGQVDKVSQAKAAMARAHVRTLLATRNVLSPQQWQELKSLRMDFHRRFGQGRGARGRGMMMRQMSPKQ